MLLPSLPRALAPVLSLALLAACSDARSPGGVHLSDEPVRTFSEEERVAARALSIGNRGVVVEADNPRAQAVACSSAIGELAERFRQKGGLTGEQLATLDRAKAVYDRRVELLGGPGAGSQGETNAEQQEEAEESVSGENALQAIGCIQKLAQAG